jgi:hypothetical protein
MGLRGHTAIDRVGRAIEDELASIHHGDAVGKRVRN